MVPKVAFVPDDEDRRSSRYPVVESCGAQNSATSRRGNEEHERPAQQPDEERSSTGGWRHPEGAWAVSIFQDI